MGGGIRQGGERPWVFKITLAMRFGSHGGSRDQGRTRAVSGPGDTCFILRYLKNHTQI